MYQAGDRIRFTSVEATDDPDDWIEGDIQEVTETFYIIRWTDCTGFSWVSDNSRAFLDTDDWGIVELINKNKWEDLLCQSFK